MNADKFPRTSLGFRDITEFLKSGSFRNIERNQVIRNVYIDWEKIEKYPKGDSRLVYHFYERNIGIRGRVFPNDELISTNNNYDLIVKNVKPDETNHQGLNLDCQVYHDLNEGLKLNIQISDFRVHPCFHIFNQIAGYVTSYSDKFSNEVDIADKLSIEITKLKRTTDKKYFLECKALDFIQ
ncbi:MAG: hypothetical protein WC867_04120 [Candidatus Pacearchaeota archaeon]|jgi:hypothetical protein